MRQRPVILCVDDQKEILDSLEDQILQWVGDDFECELAESGEEALELIQELTTEVSTKVAVIVSDHLMPGMKGDEFLIRAHGLAPETVKILLTGQASIQAVRNVINQARLYRYVEKPWDEGDLMRTIEEAAKSFMQYLQLVEYNRMLRLLNHATQELSSEIRIDRLFQKFMDTAMQSAEAERGYILVQSEGEMNVEAVASVIKDEAQKLHLKRLNDNPELTTEVLTKVENMLSKEPKPAYQVVSPIYNAGKHIGYVYLENPMTRAAFNDIQKEILQMLASQAAISIENANLYASTNQRTIELEEEKQKLAEVNHIIEQKNKDVTDSIRYARRIQEAILPEMSFLEQAFPDSFCLYIPKDIVSGDFYWWLDAGDKFLFAAVDCTGYGVPGAFMSVMASSFLTQIVNEYSIYEPEVILNYLNHRVITTLKSDPGQQDSKDGMDIAICSFDKKAGKLDFAGAKRSIYLLRNGELTEHEGSRSSIGDLNEDGSEAIYEGISLQLEKGDSLYIFTDGIADQFGGDHYKKFQTKRVKEILLQNQTAPMTTVAQVLTQGLNEWRGDHELTDDILMIGVRY